VLRERYHLLDAKLVICDIDQDRCPQLDDQSKSLLIVYNPQHARKHVFRIEVMTPHQVSKIQGGEIILLPSEVICESTVGTFCALFFFDELVANAVTDPFLTIFSTRCTS
jgi:hypothetical protein